MEKLLDVVYDFQQVDDDPKSVKYDFVSLGEKEVPKRVSFVPYKDSLSRFYNLGLTNITINQTTGEETLSDMSRENNKGDGEKVIKTTFVCALDFLSQNSTAIVVFQGNTSLKQRLYKGSVNRNFEELSQVCVIKGGYFEDLKLYVDPDTGEKTPAEKIDLRKVKYVPYTISDSNKYHFITFQLKEQD